MIQQSSMRSGQPAPTSSARRPSRDRGARPRALRWGLAIGLILWALIPGELPARDRTPFAVAAGLDVARAAAQVWSHDAVLVYVENDEDLDGRGAAPRWGYLFHSAFLKKSRAYSVCEGKILVAENLEMKLEAPPLADHWIDSGAALQAADEKAGREFCREHGGRLRTMLLMRGAFAEEDPDETTWMLVYTAPQAPSLFVVVGASNGAVRRTWRG